MAVEFEVKGSRTSEYRFGIREDGSLGEEVSRTQGHRALIRT